MLSDVKGIKRSKSARSWLTRFEFGNFQINKEKKRNKNVVQTCNNTFKFPQRTGVLWRLVVFMEKWIISITFRWRKIKNLSVPYVSTSSHWLQPALWHIYAGIGWLTEHLRSPAELWESKHKKESSYSLQESFGQCKDPLLWSWFISL